MTATTRRVIPLFQYLFREISNILGRLGLELGLAIVAALTLSLHLTPIEAPPDYCPSIRSIATPSPRIRTMSWHNS